MYAKSHSVIQQLPNLTVFQAPLSVGLERFHCKCTYIDYYCNGYVYVCTYVTACAAFVQCWPVLVYAYCVMFSCFLQIPNNGEILSFTKYAKFFYDFIWE